MNSAASVKVPLLPPADIVIENGRMVSVSLGDGITPVRIVTVRTVSGSLSTVKSERRRNVALNSSCTANT